MRGLFRYFGRRQKITGPGYPSDNQCVIVTMQMVFEGSGEPNDRKFPDTLEVSQMVFSMLQKPVWLICIGELWSSRKF